MDSDDSSGSHLLYRGSDLQKERKRIIKKKDSRNQIMFRKWQWRRRRKGRELIPRSTRISTESSNLERSTSRLWFNNSFVLCSSASFVERSKIGDKSAPSKEIYTYLCGKNEKREKEWRRKKRSRGIRRQRMWKNWEISKMIDSFKER